SERGIQIPATTQFLGGLHDTTRDEMIFFDEVLLNDANRSFHLRNKNTFNQALDLNSKERSRRFDSIETKQDPETIHDQIRKRSVSLFEPRPELNHATNSLCIIAPRALTRDVFLDRRAFFNSYNYKVDRNGDYLLNILKAAAPVCGGINLEYYFSRVDNYKLGAGTKLPHNVMGLIGVANGIEGDLRPGLPSQMIEVHEPVRLLMIIEHFADVVLSVLQRSPETNSWFLNEWIGLIVIDPETEIFYRYVDGKFEKYETLQRSVEHIADIKNIIESDKENLNVYIIK
ncbi:MAG TPA: Na-translocating system protein MpsB, partial [Bacteroidia bacterium]|nr:Na-translocating system protein MpsB [Bacteroidia bacterium]